MFLKVKKARGILEYTLLLGAIVAIVVMVLMRQGGLASHVKDIYGSVSNGAGSMGNSASNSQFGIFNANDAS